MDPYILCNCSTNDLLFHADVAAGVRLRGTSIRMDLPDIADKYDKHCLPYHCLPVTQKCQGKSCKDLEVQLEFFYICSLIYEQMSKEEVISDEQKAMARYAKAMGHPIRIYVLELLSKQSCCYSGDLTEVLPIAKSTLSQHLKELKDAGLIQGETEAPKIKYCLNQKNWEVARSLFKNFLTG